MEARNVTDVYRCMIITAADAPLAQVSLEADIAKIVYDNLWNLYVEDAPKPQIAEEQTYA